jgi:hypothetical protein
MPGVGNTDQKVPGPVTLGGAGEEWHFRSSQAHRGRYLDRLCPLPFLCIASSTLI